ncbi:MAG: DNA methyltransferase [Candidatus Methanoperedens sp.]
MLRNLILRYTQPGELVLDQMMGSGSTLVEWKHLGQRGMGVDNTIISRIYEKKKTTN